VLLALTDESIAAHIMERRQWAQQLPGRITTAGKLAGTILIHRVTELGVGAVAT
jgi:hypothetical protein